MKFSISVGIFLTIFISGITSIPRLINNATVNTANMEMKNSKLFNAKNGTIEILMQDLFQGYNKNVRPFGNYGLTTIVNVSIETGYLIQLRWVDPRLSWDPAKYNNIMNITVPANTIWQFWPSIYNSMSIAEIMNEEYLRARIKYDGSIRVVHPQYVSCTCKIAIGRFPFDTQFCPVELESPILTTNEMDVNIVQPDDSESYFEGNNEYEVSNVTVYYDRATDLGNTRARYYFVFQIERQPAYYIGVIVIPTFLTMALSILGIFAPGTSAEDDVGKGLATFFALTVLLSIVADSLPKSDTMPLLGIFILINIIICVLTVIIAMLIGYAREKKMAAGRKPSKFLCRIFFIPYEQNSDVKTQEITENGYTTNNNNCLKTNENLQNSDRKVNEVDAFKSSLLSLIDVHKENLEKLRKGNEPELDRSWEVIFKRIDLCLLVIFEGLIFASLIYFASYAWEPKPDMLKTFIQLYY